MVRYFVFANFETRYKANGYESTQKAQCLDKNSVKNVFVKPNEQNRACSSYAMARKGRMKSNDFVKPDEAYKRYCKREQRKFTFNLSSAAISYPMSDNEICICSWREIALWKRKKSCTYKNLFVT